ncbi:MAG: polysaccharide deacetylase family protein [Pseudonocardiaceae bacterium]|nr:polysaccharide deacetylase family protein [Pseudonocardiaceae bacterium]
MGDGRTYSSTSPWRDGQTARLPVSARSATRCHPDRWIPTEARSWGEHGVRSGIWRLLDILRRRELTRTVMTSAMFAKTAPDAVRAIADVGHEVCAYAMSQDVLPVMLSTSQEREHVERCRQLLESATGVPGRLDQPARHAKPEYTKPAHRSRLHVVRRLRRR